ncbi:unnamed protein product [Rhizophagus irregularis]|nr:unnamed protein product [Rhizophagus irregularis]CAB5349005.1 unnamed protein product [Rhizophagus irregularis]
MFFFIFYSKASLPVIFVSSLSFIILNTIHLILSDSTASKLLFFPSNFLIQLEMLLFLHETRGILISNPLGKARKSKINCKDC